MQGRTYYVYTLSYPSTHPYAGKVFYVGKGTRSRMFEHEDEAAAGKQSRKCNVIREIWSRGEQVQKTIVYQTQVECDALIYEWVLINMVYGSGNLTNVQTAKNIRFRNYERSVKPLLGLQRYRKHLGWTQEDLASRSGLNTHTTRKAEAGLTVSARTARSICQALSIALNRRVFAKDIDGLNVLSR
jgi:DNA-binding XRE family transcriptional regulator